MTRSIFIISLFLLAALAGCTTAPDEAAAPVAPPPAAIPLAGQAVPTQPPDTVAAAPVSAPPAAAPAADQPYTTMPFHAGQSVHIQAKVELGGNGEVYLVTLWESRSKSNYEVISANRTEIAKAAGQIVIADGVLVEAAAFHGTIRVTSWAPQYQYGTPLESLP